MSKEMTREQACDALRNAAWLGTNEDRERIERAVELLCGEPCEDAISREATLKPYNGLNDEDTISVWLIRKNIEQQPSVTPQEPKTGHWIEYRCDMYICSECDNVYTDLSGERYGMNYCPNCGARMESEEQE